MVVHNAVATISKRECGMSRRKCIHENELNGKVVLGHVLKPVSLLHTRFLKRSIKKGRAAVKGDCVNRGAVYD